MLWPFHEAVGKGISQQTSAYTYNESSSGIHDSVERIYIPETQIICRSLLARKPFKDTMYGKVIPIGQNDGCTARTFGDEDDHPSRSGADVFDGDSAVRDGA